MPDLGLGFMLGLELGLGSGLHEGERRAFQLLTQLHDLHQEWRPEERAIVALGQWPPDQLEQVRGAAVRLLQLRVRVCDGRGLVGDLGCYGTR